MPLRLHTAALVTLLMACGCALAQEPEGAFRRFANVRYNASDNRGIAPRGQAAATVGATSSSFATTTTNSGTPPRMVLPGFLEPEGVVGGTPAGPLLLVRTLGQLSVESPSPLSPAPTDGGEVDLSLGAQGLTNLANALAIQQGLEDPFEALLQAQTSSLITALSDLRSLITIGATDEPLAGGLAASQDAEASLLALQGAINQAIATDPNGAVVQGALDAEVAQVLNDLNRLNDAVAGLTVTVDSGGDNQGSPIPAQRLADDINDNGSAGTVIVRADLDGDGVIEADEVAGVVTNNSDLFQFNVFFDTAAVAETTRLTSLEVAKQHVFSGRPGDNTAASGWRIDAFVDDWSLGAGEEVRGLWGVGDEAIPSANGGWLRDALADLRLATYGTAGLRGVQLDNRFSFLGTGSILGSASVEQANDHLLLGPQLGFGLVAEASRFRLDVALLGLVGYGRVEYEQSGSSATSAAPGALNRTVTQQTTSSSRRAEDDHVGWLGEARVTASCRLTERLRLDATWRYLAVGPTYNAAESVVFAVPDFGLRQGPSRTTRGHDWFVGLNYTW